MTLMEPISADAGRIADFFVGKLSFLRHPLALASSGQVDVDASYQGFVRSVQGTVNGVEQAYWDLVYAIRNLDVQREARTLAADLNRLQEVVVTGVQISAWRWDGLRLADLVRSLLAETDAPRLRLTSIAPWVVPR